MAIKKEAHMTTAIAEKSGWIRRIWQTVMAMDYSPYDYALDRVGALEREVLELRDEVKTLRAVGSSGDPVLKVGDICSGR